MSPANETGPGDELPRSIERAGRLRQSLRPGNCEKRSHVFAKSCFFAKSGVFAKAGMMSVNDLSARKTGLSPSKKLLLEKLRQGIADRTPASRVIARRSVGGPVALSFTQQRLWLITQLTPDTAAYNMPCAVRLAGALNIDALSRSLREIVRRHESLRTTFAILNNQPVQIIADDQALELPVLNLSHLPADEREASASRLIAEQTHELFDLVRGPLLRASLLRLSEEDHILAVTIHHLVSDAWSMGILVEELMALYPTYCKGTGSPLPDLPIQYADFALWQREWLRGPVLEAQVDYWKKQLSGAAQILELPSDRIRSGIATYGGARQHVKLSKEVSEALDALSRAEGVTLFMTLLAAYQVLLFRYNQYPDVVVGAPVANRTCDELEVLIGFFVNTLVLRTDLSGNPTVQELLARVREVTLGAYSHQDLPFEMLVNELHPKRDLSLNPIFQTTFALQNAPMRTLELPGLTLSRQELDFKVAQFDLELHLWESSEGISGFIGYSTDLFDAATINRMAGHFQTLVEGIARDPRLRVAQLPLLTEAERQQLLVEWNDTAMHCAGDLCAHELFPTVGRPIANMQIYLLDSWFQPVPIGVAGEIYVGGEGLARGYSRADFTAEKFIPDPFGGKPGSRLYKTGNLGRYLPDGNIRLLGRIDDQVRISGSRIQTAEVEAALAEHGFGREAIVLGIEDESGAKRLVAYLGISEERKPTTNELRDWLKGRLPEYMIPSVFILLEKLPRKPDGTVDRRALPPPAPLGADARGRLIAPRDVIEYQLVQLWEEIFGISPIGITEDFFQLGGHSLLAVRLMAQIKKRFGQIIPLSSLFQSPDIEHLAALLRGQNRASPRSPLVAINTKGSKRPLFFVHEIGGGVIDYVPLARHLGQEQPFYGLQAVESEDFVPIEHMAAQYIEAMREAQPGGPYLLGGWSFGAIVAFEMAQQLLRQRQEVSLLAILDIVAPVAENKSLVYETPDLSDAALLARLIWKGSAAESSTMMIEVNRLEPEKALEYVLDEAKRIRALPAEFDLPQVQNWVRGYRNRLKALLAYNPTIYPEKITLLRAEEVAPHDAELKSTLDRVDVALGWGELSTKPVNVHFSPGTHRTIVLDPNAKLLAERIAACVKAAN